MFNRVLIIGDDSGIPILLESIDKNQVVAVVIASIRRSLCITLENQITAMDIPIIKQPRYLSSDYSSFYNTIKNLNPDCIICNSYSMLIREDILKLVNYNAFNVHSAYLPHNKGPNPIQWAIINKDNFTGVTIHCMDNDFDSGDIINQIKEPIYFEDTWVSLRDRLSIITNKLIINSMPKILSGKFSKTPQNKLAGMKNFRLTPDFPKIDFLTMSDLEIYNLIRAQIKPLSGAYIMVNNQPHFYNEFVPFDQISQLRKCYT